MDAGAVLIALIGSPNVASRHPVYEQYDATVQASTVVGPGRGAAVLRIRGTRQALVASTDGNARVSGLDPWLGAAMSVAEATRNVSITGARPLGVTNCLNYGDPTRPAAFWQLQEAVRGLGDACRALGVPVTGGNVSLYNESPTGSILPTPQVGVVGLLADLDRLVGPALGADGDLVLLLGTATPGLAGSEYARLAGLASEDGPPVLDLAAEAALQRCVRAAIDRRLLQSAHDVGEGGLAVALAESAIWGRRGARLRVAVASSPAGDLFGESPSRVVVSCRPADAPGLRHQAADHGVPIVELGTVGGGRLVIELAGAGATGAAEERGSRVADSLDVPVEELDRAWRTGLARALGWDEGA
jgi:phosphoribosylformylglycinamidine synthase